MQQKRICFKFHHRLQIEHVGVEIIRATPGGTEEHNVCFEMWRYLEEVTGDELDPVIHSVNSGVMSSTLHFDGINIHSNNWGREL